MYVCYFGCHSTFVSQTYYCFRKGRSSGFLSNISVSPIYATGVADFLLMIRIVSCGLKAREPCPLKIRNMGRGYMPNLLLPQGKMRFLYQVSMKRRMGSLVPKSPLVALISHHRAQVRRSLQIRIAIPKR